MKVTEPIVIGTNKEGKRIFIKRPCQKFADIASYQEAFAAEAKQGEQWLHPNLLRYIGLQKNEKGTYIALEFVSSLPLSRALPNGTLHINNVAESRRVMNQLMDAVSYLHAQHICHLNISPENIYIIRSTHDVRLANPANTYAACTPSFFIYKEQCAAPELFAEGASPTPACDIYSLGKVMEYLYAYSHLSLGIRRVIGKATHPNPDKRYASVEQMKKAFNRARYADYCTVACKGVAVLAMCTLVYYGLRDEPVPTETLQFIEETQKATDRKEFPTALPEATYTVALPSDTLRYDEEEHRRLAEQIFKKEFRKRAEKVVAGIYTPQKMNADQEAFQKLSMDGFSQLDRVQKELADQFNMDPILATRLSSEVISELTTESMKKLQQNEGEED